MPSWQRALPAAGSRSADGGNFQPGQAAGSVLAAAAAVVADTDGAVADGASLG